VTGGDVSPVRYELLEEQRIGDGGFLSIRRLRLRVVGSDGRDHGVGLWDFVERPVGLDAVVLALWTRDPVNHKIRVLLRAGLRVPLVFGRPEVDPASPTRLPELVAGIVEVGEEAEEAIRRRAADEALEEAGLTVDVASVTRLGPPMFPTPGMCAERFHFCACEVPPAALAAVQPPTGDGSPFEEGAELRWVELDEALAAVRRGELPDLKTEVGLRRLAETLATSTSGAK
jgi:ADP-ribose pyrophosphatase